MERRPQWGQWKMFNDLHHWCIPSDGMTPQITLALGGRGERGGRGGRGAEPWGVQDPLYKIKDKQNTIQTPELKV